MRIGLDIGAWKLPQIRMIEHGAGMSPLAPAIRNADIAQNDLSASLSAGRQQMGRLEPMKGDAQIRPEAGSVKRREIA